MLNNYLSPLMTNGEILAISNLLLESRALPKSEMIAVLGKLVSDCVPQRSMKLVSELLANEAFHLQGTRILSKHSKNDIMCHDALLFLLYEVRKQSPQGNVRRTGYAKRASGSSLLHKVRKDGFSWRQQGEESTLEAPPVLQLVSARSSADRSFSSIISLIKEGQYDTWTGKRRCRPSTASEKPYRRSLPGAAETAASTRWSAPRV